MTDLSIIPFGGVRENGKNMYAVTVNDEIFIFDAGLNIQKQINLVLMLSCLILSI